MFVGRLYAIPPIREFVAANFWCQNNALKLFLSFHCLVWIFWSGILSYNISFLWFSRLFFFLCCAAVCFSILISSVKFLLWQRWRDRMHVCVSKWVYKSFVHCMPLPIRSFFSLSCSFGTFRNANDDEENV